MTNSEKNNERVSRLLEVLNCKNMTELAQHLNKAGAKIYRQNICRWKSKGMLTTTAVLIDLLLNEIDRLNEEIKADD